MDGENGKVKHEGARGERGRDKLMRICACEQVSAKKGEGGGRRKANGKVCASKQVSTHSLFRAFLPSILGFSQPKMNPSASPKANTMEVWCPAAIFFDFFCDFKK